MRLAVLGFQELVRVLFVLWCFALLVSLLPSLLLLCFAECCCVLWIVVVYSCLVYVTCPCVVLIPWMFVVSMSMSFSFCYS